ncbi:MAG: VOC family protein [Granulosicoccus sp.]|nr:VOC family protein [Granulosicoccus sp.]
MHTNLKIDYLELPAQNFDAQQSFYQRVFDWTFQDYGPEYRAFSDGTLDGGFYKSTQVSSSQLGAALVIFYASDLEAVEQSVVEAGGAIVKPIFSFPGGRRFHFTDPHGNELAVWTDVMPASG